jgi:hypothetical protein
LLSRKPPNNFLFSYLKTKFTVWQSFATEK